MEKGINRASLTYKVIDALNKVFDDYRAVDNSSPTNSSKSLCIFLSHKKEDKEACLEISKYLEDAGIDYYLDIYDENLQVASDENNPFKITECLKNGIRSSSHMIVVVSEKTKDSQWVPFEIGFGHASLVDKNLKPSESSSILDLAFLTLKEISDIPIPDFLQIATPIRGIRSLNEYLEKIKPSDVELKKYYNSEHSLEKILKWNK